MSYNKLIERIEKIVEEVQKEPSYYKLVAFWFEEDYVIIASDETPELYSFEPNTESYIHMGAYPNFFKEFKKNQSITINGKQHEIIAVEEN